MGTQRKAVIVRKFTREWSAGYAVGGLDAGTGDLELLDQTGKVLRLSWETIKWVCYVRELGIDGGDPAGPERLLRRRFAARPRTPGVWLRLLLRDGEELEGLAANDRSLIDGGGLLLTPPDTRSNTQRIFVPRTAIERLEVVGVIGTPTARRRGEGEDQPDLFAGNPEAV